MPPDPDLTTRVQRLEEAQGFAEHAADQMLDHLRALDRSVRSLSQRLEQLESRVLRLSVPPNDPPATPDTTIDG